MSVLHAAAQTVAATVAPTPSASPVVQAAVQAHAAASSTTTTTVQSLQDELNKLSALLAPYVLVMGATLAVWAQSLLNKLPWLQSEVAKIQDLKRVLLAVALPLAGTFLAGLATGQNTLHLAPWVFVLSQVIFAAYQSLRGEAAAPVMLASEAPSEG